MRVLFVNTNQSRTFGGVERWMMDAAAGLAARGHSCVMLGRPRAPWAAAARARGIRVRDDHYGAWIMRVLRLRSAIRAERPDVVVVKAKKVARMASWARATGGGGRVALFFGLTGELDPKRWLDRHTWRRVDAGIDIAYGSVRWYVEHGFGPPQKHYVFWKGVDLAPFDLGIALRSATREGLGLGEDEIAIGTVCRLAWQKGLDRFFAAIPAIRSRVPGARFLVVGGGRDAPLVEAEAAKLGGAVRFLGQRDDVPALLAALDVFVQPSRQEVMVQTTLEAMAAGRAVVSTATVGADEAIEDGASGVIVPVEDHVALADAVAALAGAPARRAALGRAARARIERHFTMEQMLARCETVLQAIARGEGAPGPPTG
ncbi:MAG TPA: glycosyltransferase family 4 protein [Candidatus Eisenbacteria bacterium]|nr:glycosyltransferase family 4 protein [Candidatus Eisenbacteria bacterium]